PVGERADRAAPPAGPGDGHRAEGRQEELIAGVADRAAEGRAPVAAGPAVAPRAAVDVGGPADGPGGAARDRLHGEAAVAAGPAIAADTAIGRAREGQSAVAAPDAADTARTAPRGIAVEEAEGDGQAAQVDLEVRDPGCEPGERGRPGRRLGHRAERRDQ